MYLLSTEESDDKLNPCSTTTRPGLLPRLARCGAPPSSPVGLRKSSSDGLRKAKIQALRNKIHGWCESALCA